MVEKRPRNRERRWRQEWRVGLGRECRDHFGAGEPAGIVQLVMVDDQRFAASYAVQTIISELGKATVAGNIRRWSPRPAPRPARALRAHSLARLDEHGQSGLADAELRWRQAVAGHVSRMITTGINRG